MAATLQHKAALALNQPSSAFFSGVKNPVLNAFEEEYRHFIQYMKKRVSPAFRRKDDEPYSRGSNILFGLWNKFESRLPSTYYQQKVIAMGDFLVSIKKFNLAVWQCYGRYLDQFGDQHIEDIVDINTVKEIFFPQGLDTDHASFTFRALYGKSICNYQLVLMTDPKLQNSESVTKCLKILAFLRLITQIVLPHEPLCWLVYNGTIHIYSVSRHLMTLCHSAKVLEYLLWACMCMENSIPLMAVHYLTWRTTLYTAVCQCYYDCKASQHAETFARRALVKVNELSQLEKLSSSSARPEIEAIFRQSAVKLGIMIYKKAVFDARKRTKGLLRPKTRNNLKDSQSPTETRTVTILASDGRLIWHKTSKQRLDELNKKQGNQPWPRTAVEKLLSDMFEGSGAQFLAILETLSDSTRRTLLTSPAAPDAEDYVLDTYSELFFAGIEIIAGGGGHNPRNPQSVSNITLAGVNPDKTLIERATSAEDGIPISAVVKFVKWAYNYEQWEVYDMLIDSTLQYIRNLGDPKLVGDLKSLELLQAMEPLNPNRKSRKGYSHLEEGTAGSEQAPTLPIPPSAQQGSLSFNDNLIQVSEILFASTKDSSGATMDRDMIVDATLYLWSRCKAVFQKFQTGSAESARYLQRMDNPSKWVHILCIIQDVMYWCGIGSVDPGVTAEVAIRLALVLENNATSKMMNPEKEVKMPEKKVKNPSVHEDTQSESTYQKSSPVLKSGKISVTSITGRETATSATVYTTTILQEGPEDQLLLAREFLDRALNGMADARTAVATTDGNFIADISWAKVMIKQRESQAEGTTRDVKTAQSLENPEAVHHTIMDLHLELLYIFHRVCLKLAALAEKKKAVQAEAQKMSKMGLTKAGVKAALAGEFSAAVDSEDELLAACGKNLISKALFNMQIALQMGNDGQPKPKQKELLEQAQTSITKAQDQEHKLYQINTQRKTGSGRPSGLPPAPILVCRTNKFMVFKPAPFNPTQKVAWYRIFARPLSGSNVKVRLNDYTLPGTGKEIPAYDCELRVSGLTTNEKYIFAVAAYTADGQLIGDAIGDTSKPILASHPLPVLLAWAFLSQAAYQVGCYHIGLDASSILWDHFVAPVPPPDTDVQTASAKEDYQLTLRRLDSVTASVASPLLLRMFLSGIFINVDVSVREGTIYCDKLCDKGPYYKGQIQRLRECERMMVALELAGWLNEASLALQAVVQCYGLLAPIIYFKIPSIPVVQVLLHCYAVLQEIPTNLRQRRQQAATDSLHHMVAVITFYLAKVLRSWKQRNLSNHVSDHGKKMLVIERDVEKLKIDSNAVDFIDEIDPALLGQGANTQTARRRRYKKAGQQAVNVEGTQNEELRALEGHILKLSKLAHNTDELTGSEDPNILHAFISLLPSRYAYKEVVKFRRRARYLEFFVQVVQKALSEGLVDIATEWCDETVHWLIRRNEQLSAVKATLSKQPGGVVVAGEDPKKYAAAVVEFSKTKGEAPKAPSDLKPNVRKRKKKIQLLAHIRAHVKMPESVRQELEERELQAFEKLEVMFPEFYRMHRKKQRLRRICSDEMPWRAHMNILQGLCHFAQFLGKVDKRGHLLGSAAGDIYRSSYLDNEWFTFETSGTLLVGWDGGPSRSPTQQNDTRASKVDPIIAQLHLLDPGDDPNRQHPTAIEVAALATVGEPVPIIPPPPDDKVSDTLQTYRSNDSEKDTKQTQNQHLPLHDISGLSTQATVESLKKSFDYLKKAVVLSHRGNHWNLLQNSCRAMWNCAHTALLYCFAAGYSNGLLTVDALRALIWRPFYFAMDCLLDMLITFQNNTDNQKKPKKASTDPKDNAWIGDVFDEKGGASLKFENSLDDGSSIDSRWLRRMVLRGMEMLYFEQQWEKLADVAMKFNMLSNDRYLEQVSPLLVLAQRKLIAQIQTFGGPPVVQPHFKLCAEANNNQVPTSKNYMTMQLIVEKKDAGGVDPIDIGGRIDPAGHHVYDCSTDAMKVVSVPLDVKDSLRNLCDVLDKSSYTARALQHSRKLLTLYLASQQNSPLTSHSMVSSQSHVGFSETDDNPQQPVPADMTKSEFRSALEVQTPALPKSQLATVISSYDKTIEMLLGRKQNGLAAQAMHELGNIHYHSGHIRAAYKWWSDALDLIFNTLDTLHNWRQVVSENQELDISSQLLSRCGIWGCVLGAVLSAKIAQYVLTSDLGLRMESCFLSGFLFKGLFRTTLPHPTADRDYALYDIGEGCEVQYLVPGVDLLSDRFRCDGRTLVSSLRWVTEELARGRHNLMVLPLLSLYQYLTTYVCRDLQRAVDGRILKVRILTDLSLYSEAFIVLGRLLHGERLPQTADSNFRQVESKMPTQKFNTSKSLTEPVNLKMLEYLLDKRLSPSLATLYGPHLTCHLSLVQAHLMVAIAGTINVLPDQDDVHYAPQPPPRKPPSPTSVSTISRAPNSTISKKDKQNTPRITLKDCIASDDEASLESVTLTEDTTKKLTGGKKLLTMERIKGVLLKSAEHMLKLLVEVIEGQLFGSISAAELELITLAKLELASVCRQRHLSILAADVVAAAMKALQESDIFKSFKKEEEKTSRPSSMKGSRQKLADIQMMAPEDSPSQFQFQNFQSRSRLDGRLWLSCRLALVQSLLGQVRGMGSLGASSSALDCRQCCMQGLAEAEVCGDVEMQAEFLMQGALLDLSEGRDLGDVQHTLEEILALLGNEQTLSPPAGLLQVLVKVQHTDLMALMSSQVTSSVTFSQTCLNTYQEAHELLLQQVMQLGERIDHHQSNPLLSTPSAPVLNLYLPHLLFLAKTKTRMGHTLGRFLTKIGSDTNKPSRSTVKYGQDAWITCAAILETGLELSSICATQDNAMQAEIQLHLGKVQRQLYGRGFGFSCRRAVSTLLGAINKSIKADHDLGLIRQAYSEIAMAYLQSSSQKEPVTTTESLVDLSPAETPVLQAKKKRGTPKKSSRPVKTAEPVDSQFLRERKREYEAAWVALRAATMVAEAQRTRSLLIGDPQLTSAQLKDKVIDQLPDFAQQDLFGDKPVPKAPPTPHPTPNPQGLEPVEEVVPDAKSEGAISDLSQSPFGMGVHLLTWVHLVGYTGVLQRMCNLGSAGVGGRDSPSKMGDILSEDGDLGFRDHYELDSSINHDVIRNPLLSSPVSLRLQRMNHFLSTHLSVYANCMLVEPPTLLNLPFEALETNLRIPSKVYAENKSTIPHINLPTRIHSSNSSEKTLLSPSDNELCFQWYQPAMHTVEKERQKGIIFLYSVATPKPKSTTKGATQVQVVGKMELSLQSVSHLHNRLAALRQKGEISLSAQVKPLSASSSPGSTGLSSAGGSSRLASKKSRRTARIAQLSAQVKKDEDLEALLRQCLNLVEEMLTKKEVEVSPSAEIPFEVDLPNIHSFERLFDPSYGSWLKGTKLFDWLTSLLNKQDEQVS